MNSIRCRQCKHYIEANVGEGKIYGCDRSKCVFEPITKNSPEIDMAIKIIKADSLAPYSVEDILKARDLAVEALKQMRTAKNSLSAEEVTALAEWTEKLTKASEDAYNKGYADGMKAQEPRKGKWLAIHTKDNTHEMTCSCCGYVRVELINRSFTEEIALEHLKDMIDENKFCPNCGADMREVEE